MRRTPALGEGEEKFRRFVLVFLFKSLFAELCCLCSSSEQASESGL